MYERVRVPDHETVKHAMVTLISEKKQHHLVLTKKKNVDELLTCEFFKQTLLPLWEILL